MLSTFWPDQIDAHRLLVQVGAGRTTCSYKNNQIIYSQGEDAEFVLFVQEGCVQLTGTSEHGIETVLGTAKEGQFFGETCLHNVPLRIATATAISDCRITSVTKAAMLSAIQTRAAFAKMFIDHLWDRDTFAQIDLLTHVLKPAKAA
jgi:CRP/FNR family transcriptional regulator, cyclic AMP receptor protein